MTKRATLLISSLLLLTSGGFGFSRSAQPDSSHDKWLQERYFEATSIEAGMTRADLMKIFRTDGGFQSFLPTTYVLKSSSMIKVDVEFDVPESSKGRIVPEDKRYLTEISADDMDWSPLAEENRPKESDSSTPPTFDKYKIVPDEQLKIKSISRPYIEQFNYD